MVSLSFRSPRAQCLLGFIPRPCHIKKKNKGFNGNLHFRISVFQRNYIYPIYEILCLCIIFTRKEHAMYKIVVDKSAYSQYLSCSVTELVKICCRNPVYCMAYLRSTFMFSVLGNEHRAYCLLGVYSTTRLCFGSLFCLSTPGRR